jgi:hypothetical protein
MNAKAIILGFGLIATIALVILACSDESEDQSFMGSADPANLASFLTETRVNLDDEIAKQQTANAVLLNAAVSEAHAWLESQAYTFVDTNSVVVYNDFMKPPAWMQDPSVVEPIASHVNEQEPRYDEWELDYTDTLVWYAFENPTHDPANHTAVVVRTSPETGVEVVVVELDVSVTPPETIRMGRFTNGEFDPGSATMDGFLDCIGAGAISSMAICAFSNCAYLHCVGAGVVGTALGCAIAAIFNPF